MSAVTFAPAEPATVESLRVGDFVERTSRTEATGARGGRYHVPAYRVNSGVESIGTGLSNHGHEGHVVRFVSGHTVWLAFGTTVTVRRAVTA